MILRLKSARYVKNYQIEVSFNDGMSGEVDLSDILEKGLFSSLKDTDKFKDFNIDDKTGVLVWKNNLDIAPEFLYERLLD